MNISKAIISDYSLMVTIDGRKFTAGEKYTILEIGYSLYILDDLDDENSAEWILTNGETIPRDESDGRGELPSTSSTLITSNSILFALAYQYWWHRNGKPLMENEPLPIPTFEKALKIQRNRKILNDFHKKYKGKLPK